MDKSNFDIIKCGQQGCDFWHILLTDGYETTEDAQKEIINLIKQIPQFQETNEHCPKCGRLGSRNLLYKTQMRCLNSECPVVEFFDDCLEPLVEIDMESTS